MVGINVLISLRTWLFLIGVTLGLHTDISLDFNLYIYRVRCFVVFPERVSFGWLVGCLVAVWVIKSIIRNQNWYALYKL